MEYHLPLIKKLKFTLNGMVSEENTLQNINNKNNSNFAVQLDQWDFKSEILLVHLEKLQSKVFLCVTSRHPFLVVTKGIKQRPQAEFIN